MKKALIVLILAAAGIASAASLYIGQNTDIDFTAELLDPNGATTGPRRCAQLTVRLNPGGSANVYLGDSSVSTSNGFVLTATDPTVTLTGGISLASLYAIAGTSNQSLSWACVY